MRVTKYPQSCLVVETTDARLLVDPGVFFTASFTLDDLPPVDAVLYTHRHADHLDLGLVDALLEREVSLYGNADVRSLVGEDRVTEVRDGQPFTASGVEVVPHDLPHVVLVDGSPGPPNTGFVIDGRLFHPGDGMEITGVSARALAVPISGPSISFHDAYRMVRALGASTVVPMHYDLFTADPTHFAKVCDLADVAVLSPGEGVDV